MVKLQECGAVPHQYVSSTSLDDSVNIEKLNAFYCCTTISCCSSAIVGEVVLQLKVVLVVDTKRVIVWSLVDRKY